MAHACGWANPSSFIAAFTDLDGTTTGRHRSETALAVGKNSVLAPRPLSVATGRGGT